MSSVKRPRLANAGGLLVIAARNESSASRQRHSAAGSAVSRQEFGDILETGRVSEEKINSWNNLTCGEAGIRTLGTGFSPYNGLANRRFRPLSHLTAREAKYTASFDLHGA